MKFKMKILIINDKFKCGGAEIYALNLKKILEKDKNNVQLLLFDNDYHEKELNKDHSIQNIRPRKKQIE